MVVFLFLTCSVGDAATANAALEAAQNALSQQSLLARAVAQQAPTPEGKAAILKDADAAEKLVPELAAAARPAIAKPSDAAAQQKLATVATKTKDVNKSLANHGKTAQQQRLERYIHQSDTNTLCLMEFLARCTQETMTYSIP